MIEIEIDLAGLSEDERIERTNEIFFWMCVTFYFTIFEDPPRWSIKQSFYSLIYSFKELEDALLFKLTWGGK